jgi:ankyrin repeat protein
VFEKQLPARPDIAQYRKQAKELVRSCAAGSPDLVASLGRLHRNHPRFYTLNEDQMRAAPVSLADAQLVLAREHGFESWPRFAAHIETLRLIREVEAITDPVAAFLAVACSPRHTGHSSGTLEHAELILARYPEVARANVHTCSVLADEDGVREFLGRDPASATAKGGPNGWDGLTHLCFSRYLRIERERSEAFVRTATALLDAGASANTGWYETIDHPNPRQIIESAIYGAAGVAQSAGVTRLLLERGADPNDEETAYHVAEGYDNTVMLVLLESGKLSGAGLTTLAVRKADWHDYDGMKLVLEHGADANRMTRWSHNPLHHALRRDNWIKTIALLLDHGADPTIRNNQDGRNAWQMAAYRGRGDVLRLFTERGFAMDAAGLSELDGLIAACALADREVIAEMTKANPELVERVIAIGGTLLAEFAGNANLKGVRSLLDLGVSAGALFVHGDGYWDEAPNSTALHVAAWRGWPEVVRELIARGAPVEALDGKGRSALLLAVKACVDSYWKDRRNPESVETLLAAGAGTDGVELPTGCEAIDVLLVEARQREKAVRADSLRE